MNKHTKIIHEGKNVKFVLLTLEKRELKKTHCRSHEGKKKIKCNICNAEFGQKCNLNKQVTSFHEGKKQFQCHICNAEFGQKGICTLPGKSH